MAQQDFALQLRQLGFAVAENGARVEFDYVVPIGKLIGTNIRIGFDAPADFPLSPPGGPHISQKIHPNKSGGEHPTGGIHDSPFGSTWQYWSRPFTDWSKTDRTARAYMAHIRRLFETQ